jgi:hypothetical protein
MLLLRFPYTYGFYLKLVGRTYFYLGLLNPFHTWCGAVTKITIVFGVITIVGLWFANIVCELQNLTLYMQRSCEFSDWISKIIFWTRYIDISMSNPASVPMPPYNQFQNFYPAGVNPYSLDPAQILASLQNTATNSNISEGANKTIFAVSDAQRQLTSELNGVEKNIYDSTGKIVSTVETHALGLRDAIERGNVGNASAIERTAANTQSTVERVNSQLATAIERNGSNIMSTTERVGGQVGSSVERNGGNITTTIERVAGEGRLTTTVADAASRQAANDSARDIMAAVERNGAASVGTSKDAFTGLLSSIERNAGENRVQTLTSSGILGNSITDVRHSILNDVNRSASEILAASTQSLNVLTKHVTDGAWEGRTAMASGFQNLAEEHLRTKHDLSVQAAQQYASQMLEAQKLAHVTDSKADTHYASQMLEAQKLAHILDNKGDAHFAAMLSKSDNHYSSQMLEAQKLAHVSDSKSDAHFAAIISKTDNQYASLMLEQQKVKECLAAQAANNFAINQLEQQKIKEVITIQLQDAKYEALKNKQDLSKEMAECCCEIKQKVDQRSQDVINTVDTLDRNRLRDEVNTINNENTILRLLDYGDYDRRGRGRGRRSRSRSRSSDRGSRR